MILLLRIGRIQWQQALELLIGRHISPSFWVPWPPGPQRSGNPGSRHCEYWAWKGWDLCSDLTAHPVVSPVLPTDTTSFTVNSLTWPHPHCHHPSSLSIPPDPLHKLHGPWTILRCSMTVLIMIHGPYPLPPIHSLTAPLVHKHNPTHRKPFYYHVQLTTQLSITSFSINSFTKPPSVTRLTPPWLYITLEATQPTTLHVPSVPHVQHMTAIDYGLPLDYNECHYFHCLWHWECDRAGSRNIRCIILYSYDIIYIFRIDLAIYKPPRLRLF